MIVENQTTVLLESVPTMCQTMAEGPLLFASLFQRISLLFFSFIYYFVCAS